MTDLTSRQAEVLALVATGCTNAEIAARLGLSRQTVRDHLAGVYAALGVHNRMSAALTLVETPTTLGGCLVFASQHTALMALAGTEER